MRIHRLIQCFVASVVIVAPAAAQDPGHGAIPDLGSISRPDAQAALGRDIPDVTLIDENGTTLRLRNWEGTPVLISPIFTSCPHVCPTITTSLNEATADIAGLGSTWQVISVSFDPGDTVEDLKAFRDAQALPANWTLAIAAPEQLDALLGTLDFRYVALEGGGFAHPSAVAVVDAGMRVSGYLHGLHYEEDEVRRALTTAWAGGSLVARFKAWIIAAAVLGALALVIVIAATGGRRRQATAG